MRTPAGPRSTAVVTAVTGLLTLAMPGASDQVPAEYQELVARYASVLAWHEETRSFARRFFLALANSCQWDACFLEAQRWAREGLKLFPRDAELLLSAGSTIEESATTWAGGSVVENPALAPR